MDTNETHLFVRTPDEIYPTNEGLVNWQSNSATGGPELREEMFCSLLDIVEYYSVGKKCENVTSFVLP